MYPYIYRVTNCTTKSEEVLFLEEVSVNFRTHFFSANVFRFPHSTDHEFFCLKLYYQAKFPQLHSGYLLRCSCPSILRTRTRRIMVSVFSTETSTEAPLSKRFCDMPARLAVWATYCCTCMRLWNEDISAS